MPATTRDTAPPGRPSGGTREAAPVRSAGLRRWIGPSVAVALFAAALWAIHRELGAYHLRDITGALAQLGPGHLAVAALLTVASYLTLTLHDRVALRYLGLRIPWRRSSFVAFVAYALGYSIGLAAVTAAAVRFRLYSAWGVAGAAIARIVALTSLSFWLGFLAVGGLVFTAVPEPIPALVRVPGATTLPLGVLLLGIVAAYVAFVVARRDRAPVVVRGHELPLPGPGTTALQLMVSLVDWPLAAGVLYVLLPVDAPGGFPGFLGVFLLAQLGGAASQIPGGLGVFESLVLLLLGGVQPTPHVLAALLAYRAIYYLAPLLLAAGLLSGREIAVRWHAVPRGVVTRLPAVPPAVLTVTTFLGGIVLLVSGATPAEAGRVAGLREFLPLPVVEASHFLSSLTGLGLLLLARGLQRRLDAAYFLTAALLAAGAAFSLAKGLDYEEAAFLLVLLGLLLPCRRHFHRRASLLSEPFTPGWIASVVLAVGATAWIGYFAHHHVEWTSDLWWTFEFSGDAPRSLRALAGVLVLVLVVASARLLRPAPQHPHPPTAAEIERAVPAVAASRETASSLALLGDKSLLFADGDRGFVMYGAAGRSLVALGDPVGPDDALPDLAWRFHDLADRLGAWPVFYQVSAARLPIYLDMGLSLVKLGEEARVPLARFSLEGSAAKGWRHRLNAAAREGVVFEIVPVEAVRGLLPELRAVSDAWLAQKNTREKGFSLGYFDDDYLQRFPAALLRVEGRAVAFANVWVAADREELSVDLMRFSDGAPNGSMDTLFLRLMLWGKEQGFRWFNLGMAPLAGLTARPRGPLWGRVGHFVFRQGESFYNFQGLRQYKEKFAPEWTPRYLAYPGRLALARAMLDVTTLVSGGLKGIVTK